MGSDRSSLPRALRGALIVLAGSLALGACSSVEGVTDVFSGPKPVAQAKPAVPLNSPGAPSVDVAASSDIHPDIWPLTPMAPRDAAIEAEVARLLAQMTLEEKVGQMLQPDLRSVTTQEVTQYHLGSVLNGGSSGPRGEGDLRATPDIWLAKADELYAASMNVAPGRPAIPVIWGIDAVHGHGHIVGATIFPQNIGLGAMRDPELVRRVGEITAREIRVTGQDWTFAPTIAVVRDDRWGRTYESFSEDPALVTQNAIAITEGLQGTPGMPDYLKNGRVLASIKHFIGDGATDHGINTGNSTYSEIAVRDMLAPPYQAAIRAGAQNVMVSYSSWRGQRMHGRRDLVTDILYGRMGFDGFVVSDYHGIADVPGCTVSDCPQSVNAGIDMIMTQENWKELYGNLINQASSGQIPMARIDEAVARILRVKLRMGLMTAGKPSSRPFAGRYDLLGSPEHRSVARQAVRESLVLLKNDGGLLPLSPRAHVLVAGDGAQNMEKQTGGWTISWQGTGTTRADFPNGATIYEGIKANVEAAGGTVDYSVDGKFREKPDVAIVVFGEGAYAEGAGDINTLEYQPGDKRDLRLLQSLKAQGIPIVAVFLSGRPLYVTPEINSSNAFIAAWQPGTAGEGVADLLFARPDGAVAYDFRGKLSFSWPRAPDQSPLNTGTEPYDPLFAFGYGLTYATPRNIGALAEASPLASARDRTVVIESGGLASTWSASLADSSGAARPLLASGSTAGLTVRQNAAGSLSLVWSGAAAASLIVSGPPGDFTRQQNMSLTMSMRVDRTPTAPVTLSMGCGAQCGSRLDLTTVLREAEPKGWTTISVPLSCFRPGGMDLSRLSAPLVLTSRGSLALSLASVRMMRPPAPATCDATPPAGVEVSQSVPAPKKAKTITGKKKKAIKHRRHRRHR